MGSQVVSLRVLAAYAQDVGRGIVRMDRRSMDILDVANGDRVKIFGDNEGTDARCYQLLPSDEGKGIARIDPALRKILGVTVDNSVTIRKMAGQGVPSEDPIGKKYDEEENGKIQAAFPRVSSTDIEPNAEDETATTALPSVSALFVLSGSCIAFEKERPKIMHFISTLESLTHTQSKSKCYSDGKKALGWDFFLLEMDEIFVEKLLDIYPEIKKQEAGSIEDRFALWMNKQLKKMAHMDYHLKLSDVPQEKIKGFRLNPEHFRD
jgi:hypothetical protein